ncbi:MAG TPA: NB-ARC domain-containing protein [Ktedonobacterales bacterium]|nr:NB-ARC domain-containing protein [Ktedonobacterales bacterium]
MDNVRLYLFGSPHVEFQGHPVKIERRKAIALAAHLACAEYRQSRDVLADMFWPDLDRDHGRSALRSALLALSTPITVDWIEADRTTVGLKRDAVWVDIHTFSTSLSGDDTHGHSVASLCAQCAPQVEQAIGSYQSGFMMGFSLSDCVDFENWQISQRESLRRELADALRRLSGYYAEMHRYAEAIKYTQMWLATDPLHEPALRQLMRHYAKNGQRAEALRQYRQYADLLNAELATPPEDETTSLYEDILRGQLLTVLTTSSVGSPLRSVLPPLPALVVGRDEALREVKERLGIGGATMRAVTVIQGWPGVGKSSIVAMLAHDQEVARHFPDGVLWASLGEEPNILGPLSAWAGALNMNPARQARGIEEISAQLTAILREKRSLLIIDDVWRTEHATPFRVGGQMCAMVVTSRLNDVAIALAPTASDLYRLPVLTDHAAFELLGQLAPETTGQYPDAARELVRDLEGLPLAIHVAGRLLHSEAQLGWGVRELLVEIRRGAGLLMASAPSDMLGATVDTTQTVAALLKRSTDVLDAETRLCFAYLGLFVPKPASFDLDAMAVAWNVVDPRPSARVLVSRGLLEPVGSGRFQMHSLLVMHARSLLEEEGFQR